MKKHKSIREKEGLRIHKLIANISDGKPYHAYARDKQFIEELKKYLTKN